jgi:hypothetical protein
MPSIFKALWSRLAGEKGSVEAPSFDAVEYNGYRIRPAPYQTGAGYQTAGVIEKDSADAADGIKEHRFVRAETHPSREAAAAFAVAKGRQIVDEQGDRLFQ